MRALIVIPEMLAAIALRKAVERVESSSKVTVHTTAFDALAALNNYAPDLAILAMETTDLDGMDYIPEVVANLTARRVVIASGRLDKRTLRTLRRTGFAGFIDSSTATEEELEHAIRLVAAGKRYVCPSAARALDECGVRATWDILSEAEQLYLSVLAAGHDNEQAAIRLSHSEASIRGYRARIMDKLELRQRSDLVLYGKAHVFLRIENSRCLHPGFERQLARIRLLLDHRQFLPAASCILPEIGWDFSPGRADKNKPDCVDESS